MISVSVVLPWQVSSVSCAHGVSSKVAVGLASKEMGGKKVETNVIRTQKDLSMKIIAFGSIFTILLISVFFF